MLLNEKIEQLQNLTKKKITYEEAAKVLGLGSKQAAQNRVTRKTHLKEWEILALEEEFLKQKVNKDNPTEEKIAVDYYPDVFGSCGNGKFVLSTQKEVIDVPKKLFQHFSSVKKYSVINAVGDSMSPTIYDKDKLIVEHWDGEQIKDNQVYVFAYNNEIFVKRLVKNVDEIVITSDNQNPIYRPRFIEKDDMNNVLIIGQIIGLFRGLR